MQRLCAALLGLVIMVWTTAGVTASVQAQESGQTADGCVAESFIAGVQCVGEDGAVKWQRVHPTLWGDPEEFYQDAWKLIESVEPVRFDDDRHLLEQEVWEPAGPAKVGGRLFYGIRYDLIEVDPEDGTVVDRVRFPAWIEGIAPKGATKLNVGLRIGEEGYIDEQSVEVTYVVDGAVPAQTAWTSPQVGFLTAQHDALASMWGIWADEFLADVDANGELTEEERVDVVVEQLSDEQIDTVVRRLEEAYRGDSTNPFTAKWLGIWKEAAGDDEKAEQWYETAAQTEAVWQELLDLSTKLDDRGAEEAAETAFERGLERMKQVGVEPKRITSLVRMTTIMLHRTRPDHGGPIREALEAEDARQVHELSLRYARAFPYLEGAHFSWSALADWMRNQGHDEWAEKWEEYARANSEQGCSFGGANESRIRTIDRGVLWLAAGGLSLFVLLFLAGMRAGVRRRLKWWDCAVLAAVALGLMVLPYVLHANSQSIEWLGNEMPMELVDDGLASPLVGEVFDEFAPGPERDAVQSVADAEHEALAAGEEMPDKQPVCQLVMEAVDREMRHRQFSGIGEGRILHPFEDVVDDSFQFAAPADTEGMSLLDGVLLVLGLLLLFAIGWAVGRFAGPVGRWLPKLVPGAGIRPAVVGDVAVVVFITSVFVLLGFDTMLQTEMYREPFAAGYVELEMITSPEPASLAGWAWAGIVLVVAAHILSVVWQWRADREA